MLDIERWRETLKGKRLVSIYFGGGTPALLSPSNLALLLKKVGTVIPFAKDHIEITLEANPETVTQQLMSEFAAAGVNRVSIGVQSLDDSHLIKLGRTHHAGSAFKAVDAALSAGVTNISIDLMYDIPGQTISSWKRTLQNACQLPITHLSLYNLTIEPHTVFFKYRETLVKELPDAQSSTAMYEMGISMLQQAGLIPYEISAFARDGKISKHNTGYWTGRSFLGFGPSGFSYIDGERFRSISNLSRYVQALRSGQSPVDFSEKLTPDASRRELFTIALRLRCGVESQKFQREHGELGQEFWDTIYRLQRDGFIYPDNNTLVLTEKGILFYDTVASEVV